MALAAFTVWGGGAREMVCELLPWIGYHAHVGVGAFYVSACAGGCSVMLTGSWQPLWYPDQEVPEVPQAAK